MMNGIRFYNVSSLRPSILRGGISNSITTKDTKLHEGNRFIDDRASARRNGTLRWKRRAAAYWLWSPHQLFQRSHISPVVTGFVNRGFGDEGGVRESRIVQQSTEWLAPNSSLPDVLMAVELRSASGFRVVAMPDGHVF
jgi:hypothetical protein